MSTTRIPGTKLVNAGELPSFFSVPTTCEGRGLATARAAGSKVIVTFLGHTVFLKRTARVRVLVKSLYTPVADRVTLSKAA